MDLIIEYLLQKGGIFGVLLAISFAWIFFREQSLLRAPSKKDEDTVSECKTEIGKILYIVADLKAIHEKSLSQLAELSPLPEQIRGLIEAKLSGIEKLNEQSVAIDNKINDIEEKIKELHTWHDVRDSEGVPVWYVRKSLEASISRLDESIATLEINFIQVTDTIRSEMDVRLQKVNKERVNELKKLLETYNKTVTDLIIALEKIKFLLKSKEQG